MKEIKIGCLIFDFPVKGILKQLFKLIGYHRLWFGNCPFCNSDAPILYECTVCESFHLHNRYDIPDKKTKQLWKNRFTTLMEL